MPKRIQRKRSKGWKMPKNAVYVGRPTKWGNPWSVKGVRAWLASVNVKETYSDRERAENCAYQYELWLEKGLPVTNNKQRRFLLGALAELRGKDLACWCPLNQKCHADVLLRLANQ